MSPDYCKLGCGNKSVKGKVYCAECLIVFKQINEAHRMKGATEYEKPEHKMLDGKQRKGKKLPGG